MTVILIDIDDDSIRLIMIFIEYPQINTIGLCNDIYTLINTDTNNPGNGRFSSLRK